MTAIFPGLNEQSAENRLMAGASHPVGQSTAGLFLHNEKSPREHEHTVYKRRQHQDICVFISQKLRHVYEL